jgi:ParB family chromosome partitioning protein
MKRTRNRVLGRGLEALIPMSSGRSGQRGEGGLPQLVPVDQVRPSPGQSRRSFEAGALRELADSIREHGLLQPILVRRQADGYELIAGERRWRAARMAGLERLPALVRGEPEDEQQSLLLGLVENLQREDLDPISEARGIQRLIEQFGLTHEQAASRLGKHRVAVSQALRLLQASPALLSATAAGAVSAGHARALVGLPTSADQEQGLKVVLARHMSVRQTERWVRSYRPPARPRRRAAVGATELDALAGELSEGLGLAVSISGSLRSGRVVIRYQDPDQLETLCRKLR